MLKNSAMGLAGFLIIYLWLSSPGFCGTPPSWIDKVHPGKPFFNFEFDDLEGKKWILQNLRGKPVIIITGHRHLKHDLLKWAQALKNSFAVAGSIHLLWVVDLSRYPWDNGTHSAEEEWTAFSPPIPLILDWHSMVGRALNINYFIPSIIGIDAWGNLSFHQMSPFSADSKELVFSKIRALLRFPATNR